MTGYARQRTTVTSDGADVQDRLAVVFQPPGVEPRTTLTLQAVSPVPEAAAQPVPSLPVAWDRDRLVITDPAVLNRKINRARLSPSAMSALACCPARWAAEKMLPSTPDPFGPAEIGTSGHKLLEELFGLPGKMRTPEQADQLLFTLAERHRSKSLDLPDLSALTEAEVEVTMTRWRTAVGEAIHGLWDIEDPTRVQVASTELSLNTVEIGGVPFVGFLDRSDFEVVEGRSGRRIVDYKGLALDTPLPTPAGWTTMGDVQQGDHLLGADGEPTTVIGKSSIHHRPCYELTFSDGTKIVCDNVHLWNVTEARDRALRSRRR